ncbi:LIM-domain binding protein-domain-containing protein [Echria macrotheca]|uniref:LIM-domain binding protein-domain-containing protein n=1 Tax=Echria macrotheca TaxID=438768 RepID=A0AAJ0B9T3_9PEZI|nr:LIM-domain binding protein-domain-containing protein [Echria macrotheca]
MNQQMGQQGPNPNQHMGPGHMNIQQAHQLAALQAQQQAAQAAQAAQQQQAQQQAQAQQQQQQQGQGQPQGQAQPQQPGPQSQGQGGPNTNGPATSQAPTQGQTPQPNSQQQPQAPPQTPQTTQAQQAQLAAQAQQVAQNAAGAAATNLIQQQQAQQQAQQQHQQKVANVNTRGLCMLKLIQFAEQLSGFPGSKSKDDLAYWNNFVHQFFSPRGLFRLTILVKEGGENRQDLDKQYELAVPALPRYFHTHFESGIKSIQLNLDKCTIDKPLPHDCYYMEYHKASLVYWFETGSHLVTRGILRAQFDHEQKIDLFEFTTTAHEEYIARDFVIQSARPVHNWIKEWRSLNQQDGTHSPEMSNKKNKQKPYKCPANPPPDLDLPMPPTKTSTGITDAVYQFLEIVEIIGQMSPLFHYYHQHPGLGPYAALEQYVGQINNAGQVVNGQNMAQGGPRTPSFNQFGMGQSPAMGNSILPGSPHVAGSPAPGQMQAPGMQLQASQQGTSSSGPSANTSPSQNNKRRRPSTVKTEDDTPASAPTPGAVGTPQVNGVAKKPPTPRMGKRQKVNPSG